jgi:hypothetical protein
LNDTILDTTSADRPRLNRVIEQDQLIDQVREAVDWANSITNLHRVVSAGWLEVVVANTGQWVAPDKTRSPSTGIRSLRKRLALLVDAAATVDTLVDPDLDGGWVRIVIRMPATLTLPPPATAAPGLAAELV